MTLIQWASGVPYVQGGNAHVGWLPPGAATPPPVPIRLFTLDVTIEYEPGDGFILSWMAREDPTAFWGDSWHGSLADAEAAASEKFGIGPDRWKRA